MSSKPCSTWQEDENVSPSTITIQTTPRLSTMRTMGWSCLSKLPHGRKAAPTIRGMASTVGYIWMPEPPEYQAGRRDGKRLYCQGWGRCFNKTVIAISALMGFGYTSFLNRWQTGRIVCQILFVR